MQGEYHWHKHDNDDEFFFVLDGHFMIDLEGRSIDLRPRQGYVVPKGVVHHIAVSPRCQGEGMGRQLMLFAEGEAKRQGYREIRLYTNERFTENIAIYARLGYRETRREQVPLGIVVHMAKPV
jgi:ribosomal protein S18 acetylase RimI-like enzyme